MSIRTAVEEAKELSNWLWDGLDGGAVSDGLRGHPAGLALKVSLEHHRGLVVLLGNDIPASFKALQRPQVDACIRGAWLAFSATEEELETFASMRSPLTEAEIYKRAGAVFDSGVIEQFKAETWPVLCDFTHTGPLQLRRNLKDGVAEANYSEEEIIQDLVRANAWAMWAATVLAGLQGNDEFAKQLMERITQ